MFKGILKASILMALFCQPFLLDAAKACGCGSFSSGLTFYSVKETAGCCTGKPLGQGVLRTFEVDKDGVYTLKESVLIEGSAAQNNCCPLT